MNTTNTDNNKPYDLLALGRYLHKGFHWGALLNVFLLSILTAPAHAGQTASIVMSDENGLVGERHQFHVNLRYPRHATRVTVLVKKPGDNNWTILAQNAPRAGEGGVPYMHWTPDRVGVHTLRVDVVTPGEKEIRKTRRLKVVEDGVSLRVFGGRPALGSSVILEAVFTGPQRNRALSFAVKYDDDNRWQTINGGRTPNSIRWFPARAGRAELRIRATKQSGERIEGFTRVLVLETPQPVRMTGDSRIEMPARKPLIAIDKNRANVGESRTLTLHLYYDARANRRVTVRYRHTTRDRDWIIYRENADRLILSWTPRHPGSYLIEASVEDPDGGEDLRQEIRFTALDPN